MGLLKALLLDPRGEAKLKGDAVTAGAGAVTVETAALEAPPKNEKGGAAFSGSSAGLEADVAAKANGRDGKVVVPVASDFVVTVAAAAAGENKNN